MKSRNKKGFFLERKKSGGVYPEEAMGNWSYMGSCREGLKVKSGKGEERILGQKHSDLKEGRGREKRDPERRKEEAEGSWGELLLGLGDGTKS